MQEIGYPHLPPRQESLWGIPQTVIPAIVCERHGDGKQLLWLSYLSDRPHFYVIAVDSSVVPDNDNDDWVEKHHEWVMEAIDQEYGGEPEDPDEDYEREWPTPPEGADGSVWGIFDPTPEDRMALEAAWKRGHGIVNHSLH